MNKKAILVISFGTSHEDTLKKTILKIEDKFKKVYEGYDFFRAFTSRMIVKKLKKERGINIDLPLEALDRIKKLGYEEVVVQPLHIMNGIEYHLTYMEIKRYGQDMNIKFGNPLLTEEDDYRKVVSIISKSIPKLEKDEVAIFMGHGTEHPSNSSYLALDYMFKIMGHENIYISTVEGFPKINEVIEFIEEKVKVKKIILIPFMIVAGDHAKNDMAGEDEDSWKRVLESRGYKVEIVLKGLGELDEIGDLFIEHSKKGKLVKKL
jgi:sirohydrochlorin cobaltochelatase